LKIEKFLEMSVINKVLGLFLGNKNERDMKEIDPHVKLIRTEFEKLGGLTNDELRNKTAELKNKILSGIAKDEE
jgi:preprotein translocase subunit SecA